MERGAHYHTRQHTGPENFACGLMLFTHPSTIYFLSLQKGLLNIILCLQVFSCALMEVYRMKGLAAFYKRILVKFLQSLPPKSLPASNSNSLAPTGCPTTQSSLTPTTQSKHQVPQVKESVSQDCPASDASTSGVPGPPPLLPSCLQVQGFIYKSNHYAVHPPLI